MDVLKSLYSRSLNDKITWYVPETGLYAYIETKSIPSESLVKKLLNSKVLVSSIRNCYIEGFNPAPGIRLCVCNASDEDIRRAVNIIELIED